MALDSRDKQPPRTKINVPSRQFKAEEIIDSFLPSSDSQLRSLVIAQLAEGSNFSASGSTTNQSGELIGHVKDAVTANLLDNDIDLWEKVFASVRLLSSLYSLRPNDAYELLFSRGCLDRISALWNTERHASDPDPLLAFAFSEMLCTASSHSETRRTLLKHSSEDLAKETEDLPKIEELTVESGTVSPLYWLATYVEKAELEDASASTMLGKTALLAALALFKLKRAEPRDTRAQLSSSLSSDSDAKKEEGSMKNEEEDAFLFEMCKRFVILYKTAPHSFDSARIDCSLHPSLQAELTRTCRLAAIEGLTYLTISSQYRQVCADSSALLQGVFHMAKEASSLTPVQSRYTFPVRQGMKDGPPQSLDNHTNVLDGDFRQHIPDTSLQYGIATLLGNILRYPQVKDKEQKQMEKLKRMANAADADEEIDELMQVNAVEHRVEQIIANQGVEALVTIALSRAKESGVSPSAGVRQAVSSALLSMTTRQDRRQRGIITQQGGAKALLALANVSLTSTLATSSDTGVLNGTDFDAMQALSQLLITENPSIVLTDPAEAVPILCFLYLHTKASPLQHFESALALTNLASLGRQQAQRIALTPFPIPILNPLNDGEFVGAGRQNSSSLAPDSLTQKGKACVGDKLRDHILLEDNAMSRCASVELLCNLLECEQVFQQWAGEAEDEETGRDASLRGKAADGLNFLLALCAPGGRDESLQQTALKQRLAAGGAIATLCSSPSTCARILASETRLMSTISRLIDPSTRDQIVEINEDGEEEDDQVLDEEDCASDPLGPLHGRWQLALRGVTIVECLVQYIQWLQTTSGTRDVTKIKASLVDAGIVSAVKNAAKQGALALKNSKQSHVEPSTELQTQVTRQSLSVLQQFQSLHILQ